MALDLNIDEVRAIAQRHYPARTDINSQLIIPECPACGNPWPCEAAQLAATVKILREDRDHLIQMLSDEQTWAETCERDRDEARQERDRVGEELMRYEGR